MKEDIQKSDRILDIYTALLDGKVVRKVEVAEKYGVSERSVQRDFETIRTFLYDHIVENGIENDLVYDPRAHGYRLEHISRMKFTNDEALAICKILLDSRAFKKGVMENMIEKLLDCCVPPENQKIVRDLIDNEVYHYVEPRHGSDFLHLMWELGQAINNSYVIEISYTKLREKKAVKRRIEPLAIMFSEYYFYLVGTIEGIDREKEFRNPTDKFPTIYRIDRIKRLKVTNEHFSVPYKDRFEAGEYRKRVQFMYGGKLRRVKFRYKGLSIEAVEDRLPTAKILSEEDDGSYIVSAEVFGDGIDMWLKSQGENVEIL